MNFASMQNAERSDQADGLRKIFAQQSTRVLPLLAPGGNQGGLSASLAAALVECGREVLVVDVTRGEVPRALGLRSRYELAHVVSGDKTLKDVVLSPGKGLRIVPAARALSGAANLGEWLAALAGELDPHPDWIVLHHDMPLGSLEGDVLVAATPLTETLRRTYSELKRMPRSGGRLRLLVNGTADEAGARNLHRALDEAAQRFIGASIDWAGFVPKEGATQAWTHLAAALDSWQLPSVQPACTAH